MSDNKNEAQKEQIKKEIQKLKESKQLQTIFSTKLSHQFDGGDANSFVLVSNSLDLSKPIAQSLLRAQSSNSLSLLVDFSKEEIDEINYWIGTLSLEWGEGREVTWIGNSALQKRRMVYVSMGAYAITSMVLLTDLLREEAFAHPARPSHLIVQMQEPILSCYNRIAWICTLLKLRVSASKVTVYCTQATDYSSEQAFTTAYRAIYAKQIAVWPFGRSDILRVVAKTRPSIKELQHGIQTTAQEQSIMHSLSKLEQFVFKGEHAIERTAYGFKEIRETNQVRALIDTMETKDKLSLLKLIHKFAIEGKKGSIWESSNTTILDLLHSIKTSLQEDIFPATRISPDSGVCRTADLGEIIDKQSVYYKFQFQFKIKIQENQKINELLKILNEKKQQMQQVQDQRIKDIIIQKMTINQKQQQIIPIILILTKNLESRDYVRRALLRNSKNKTYMSFLESLLIYLEQQHKERLTKLQRIYARQGSSKKGWVSIKEDDRIVFQSMLFLQLSRLFGLIKNVYEGHYLTTNQSIEQQHIREAFQNRINKEFWRFIDPSKIQLSVEDQLNKEIYWETKGKKKHIIVVHSSKLTLNQLLRLSSPETVIFYSPSATLMRMLLLQQAQSHPKIKGIKEVHTLLFTGWEESRMLVESVVKEDEAFWGIAKLRSSLGQFVESAQTRRTPLNIDSIQERARKEVNAQYATLASTLIHSVGRNIVVDTREFKSLLPSKLYHSGFDVHPVFLETADYILAEGVAVERKAVRTKDLIQSLQSGRLAKQIERLSNLYRRAYLLIECEDLSDCQRWNFIDHTSQNGKFTLRKKLMELMQTHPNLRLIWATSIEHSCTIFKELKRNKHDPDLSKYKATKDLMESEQEKQ